VPAAHALHCADNVLSFALGKFAPDPQNAQSLAPTLSEDKVARLKELQTQLRAKTALPGSIDWLQIALEVLQILGGILQPKPAGS
jgi:hypothetical protein